MKKKLRVILLLILVSFTLCIMSNTYSRYVADTTGDVEALFSKWQILVNDNDITTNQNTSFKLVPIINENNNVKANRLAPSSTGYFDIEIDPTLVDVSFDYEITFDILNKDMPDLMISKYAILDKDYAEGDVLNYNNITSNKITNEMLYDNTNENFKFDKFTIRVFFEWYDGNDEKMTDDDDVTASNNNETFNINANIKFSQKLN